MYSSENERLKQAVMAFIVGVPPVFEEQVRNILMVYSRLQTELNQYAQEARIGLELAVKVTVAESMTHGKQPSIYNVDFHAARGILQQAQGKISDNLDGYYLQNQLAKTGPAQAPEEQNKSRFTRGPNQS